MTRFRSLSLALSCIAILTSACEGTPDSKPVVQDQKKHDELKIRGLCPYHVQCDSNEIGKKLEHVKISPCGGQKSAEELGFGAGCKSVDVNEEKNSLIGRCRLLGRDDFVYFSPFTVDKAKQDCVTSNGEFFTP
jgi:hypothetical protein